MNQLERQYGRAIRDGVAATLAETAEEAGLAVPVAFAICSLENRLKGALSEGECEEITSHIIWARKIDYEWRLAVRMAASAFKVGRDLVEQGRQEGNPDRYTPGRDYGKDVCARMQVFSRLIEIEPPR